MEAVPDRCQGVSEFVGKEGDEVVLRLIGLPQFAVDPGVFFFQAEDGIRVRDVTGVQTCALPIWVSGVPMTAEGRFDVPAMIAALTPKTRLLMFSCPSNPVGCTLDADELQQLLAALPAQCLLVFDEAYYEYADFEADYPDCLGLIQASGKPFILLRTFSKAYSLAGLRIGYSIVSDPLLADLIDRLRTPFNINRVAQAAALAALADEAHLQATLEHVSAERRHMVVAL